MIRWTKEQELAMNLKGTNLLVSAAAGAGKTAVLVERIIRLITDPSAPVDVDRLLVVTFTNAAAAEMRERLAAAIYAKLDEKPDSSFLQRQLMLLNRASITTMHSFCTEILRQYFYMIDLDPNFRIAEETESLLLQNEVLDDLFESNYKNIHINAVFGNLVDAYGGQRDDSQLRHIILRLYKYSQTSPWPRRWLDGLANGYAVSDTHEFFATSWGAEIRHFIRAEIMGAIQLLTSAANLARMPDGPLAYSDNILEEIATINQLLAQVDSARNWNDIRNAFLDNPDIFSRLPRCGKEVNEVAKNQVRILRNKAKDALTSITDRLMLRDPEELLNDLRMTQPMVRKLVDLVIEFAELYSRLKASHRILDFDDLEHLCLSVLRSQEVDPPQVSPSGVAIELRSKFVQVLVDEYQDINEVQECILNLVSRQGDSTPNLFMVGDVKQSIYRFRLAEPGLFIRKHKLYTPAKMQNLKDSNSCSEGLRVDLRCNFRSNKGIIDAVNFVFAQTMSASTAEIDYDQDSWLISGKNAEDSTGNDSESPARSHVEFHVIDVKRINEVDLDPDIDFGSDADEVSCEERTRLQAELRSDEMEALTVARRILELSEQYEYRDIAILMRATKQRANTFVDVLRRFKIPVHADLGSGYFESTEVQVILALLQVIDNPRQDIPLAAVLRSPIVGLDAAQMGQIRLLGLHADYYDALKLVLSNNKVHGKIDSDIVAKVKQFVERYERWRTLARRKSVADLIWQIYGETGYYDFVGGLPGGNQRQANLRALYDHAIRYESTVFRGLFRFLRFLERVRESGSDLVQGQVSGENDDVVRIMSVHKSKGLEFPVVFVVGLGKRFNFEDSRSRVLIHRNLGIGLDFVDTQKGICYPTLPKLALKHRLKSEALAEELRILYVAMTRAKSTLIMVGSVDDIKQSAQKWCQAAMDHLTNNAQQGDLRLLPEYALTSAYTFLDWIGPAVVKHESGEALRNLSVSEADLKNCVFRGFSKWDVIIHTEEQFLMPVQQGPTHKSLLFQRVKNLEHVTPQELGLDPAQYMEISEKADRSLSWSYAYQANVVKPGKMSVTEIARHFSSPSFGDSFFYCSSMGQSSYPKPRSLQGFKGLSPAEIGSATHVVLQHLNLSGDLTEMGVHAQVEDMRNAGILSAQEAEVIEVPHIVRFLHSELGQRVLPASRLEREVPFSLAIPATEVYPEIQDSEDVVLIQGIIDCVVYEPDGLLIIDFKTDRLGGTRLDSLIGVYKSQICLYATALQKITGHQVKDKYIYFLSEGISVMC